MGSPHLIISDPPKVLPYFAHCIECYKILTDKENVDPLQFFHISDIKYDLRGHILKLAANRSRLNIRQNFFTELFQSTCGQILELSSQNVIDAPSVNSFNFQEPPRQVLEELWIWTLKARLLKFITTQVQVQVSSSSSKSCSRKLQSSPLSWDYA